jgi:hypothetical protein
VLNGSASEISGTSKLAEERFIRKQAARASAATGKELKVIEDERVEEVVLVPLQLGKN